MKDDAPLVDALPAVIAAWRATRHPRLAELAELIDERLAVDAPRPRLKASKKHADLEAWRAREAARDVLDFSVLMAAARGGAQVDVIAHVEALAAWDDPRLSAGLLRLLEDPPYAGVKSRDLLKAIFAALEASRDVRLPGPARELAGRYLGIVNSSTGGWIIDRLEALAVRMAKLPAPVLSPGGAAMCAALEARLGDSVRERRRVASERAAGAGVLAGLLEAVYAAPDDDGPRLVLADALQQLGDERGELIVLQVTRARGAQTPEQARREQELGTVDRLAQWAQPLSGAGSCFFERGFPVEVHLYSKGLKKTLGRPEWATVKTVTNLSRLPVKQVVELMTSPALSNVRDPGELEAPLLEALGADGRRWPWTTLRVQKASALAPSALAAVPELRELELHTGGPLHAELLGPLVHLEKLEVGMYGASPPRALFEGLRLRELTLAVTGANLQLVAVPLPPTLAVLRLNLGAPLPRGMLTGLPALRELFLRVPSLEGLGDALTLPSLQSLSLNCVGAVAGPRHLFEGVPELARLHLELRGPPVASELLRPLVRLRELRLPPEGAAPGALASLTHLESIHARKVPIDELPRGAPLREAHLTAPRVPGELGSLFARYPGLERLALHGLLGLDVAAMIPILEASAVRRVSFDGQLLLERDAAGALSRVYLATTQWQLAERLRGGLSALTELTCAPHLLTYLRSALEPAMAFRCEARAGVTLV